MQSPLDSLNKNGDCHLAPYLTYLFIVLFSFGPSFSSAQESEFVRFNEGPREWQGSLQTAINSYQDKEGRQVNLVAAIHIADSAYYTSLNEFFKTQDVVLYELVAEPGQRPTSSASGGSPLSMMQNLIARILQVQFQLQQIDYSASNFKHADLSPTQLQQLMAEKNESFFTMVLDVALAQQASAQSSGNSAYGSELTMTSLLSALSMDNQSSALKYLLGKELGRAETLALDPELEANLTLLGDRNRAALAVLDEVLSQSSYRSISLFYGAAHMPGLERAVLEKGFSLSSQSWLTAWAIQ